jgi:hypothetical protein
MRASPHLPAARPAVATRLGALAVAAVVFTTAGWYGWREQVRPRGPATLEEVVEQADRLGLYTAGDRQGGAIGCRLVVSEFPVSVVRACDLRMGVPSHPCWISTVAVCRPWRSFLPNYVAGRTVIWGDLLVIGDPEVIRRLTGLDPTQPCWTAAGFGFGEPVKR